MGARLSTLVSAVVQHRGVSAKYTPLYVAMLGSALVRMPFGWLERAMVAVRRPWAVPMTDPVFIVGHWRSGTTHLHNLLGLSPTFGYISPLASGLPDQLLTLATWLRPWLEQALPEDRHVDRVLVTPQSPQEDEIPLASQHSLSVFHALYFPSDFYRVFRKSVFMEGASAREVERWARYLRRFLEKVSWHQNNRRLILKNPVYTARLKQLRKLFPNAQFIHIYRNPYEVYASTRLYYKRLLSELALQSYTHLELDELILSTYLEMMRKYDDDAKSIPSTHLVEVRYDELQANPMGVLETIHQQLSLPRWAETRARVEIYLQSITNYQRNTLVMTSDEVKKVSEVWQPYIQRWSYDIPSQIRRSA